MKQKDIVLIIVVVFVSGVFSLILSSLFINSPKNRKTQVEVVDKIDAEFTQPDKTYFNPNSIDPTQNIRIGDDLNPDPFSGQN